MFVDPALTFVALEQSNLRYSINCDCSYFSFYFQQEDVLHSTKFERLDIFQVNVCHSFRLVTKFSHREPPLKSSENQTQCILYPSSTNQASAASAKEQ